MLKTTLKRLGRPVISAYRRMTGIDTIKCMMDQMMMDRTSSRSVIDSRLDNADTINEQIVVRLDLLSEKIDEHNRLLNEKLDAHLHLLSEKIDVLLHHRHSTDRTDQHISHEVDRLDGYLQYHMESIRQDLDRLAKAKGPDSDDDKQL